MDEETLDAKSMKALVALVVLHAMITRDKGHLQTTASLLSESFALADRFVEVVTEL